MKRIIAAAALAALVPATPALAAPDRTVSLNADTAKTVAWEGSAALGLNTSYYDDTAGPGACTKDVQTFCDTTLVHVDDDYAGNKRVGFRLDGFDTSDYDLRVHRSDATGARGTYEGTPTGMGNGPLGAVITTFAGDHETKDVSAVKAGSYLLVDVVYFSTVPSETPNLTATLK